MKTSRQIVFDFIQSHNYVTVEEISRAMHMTKANARHHVAILIDQGLVEILGLKEIRGRGRPARMFTVSSRSSARHLEKLIDVLLNKKADINPSNDYHSMQFVAKNLIDAYRNEFDGWSDLNRPESNLLSRLFLAVQLLNIMNYSARWEAHAQSPHLVLGNCPYRSIEHNHPELCIMDSYLIRHLIDRSVFHSSKLAIDERGVPHCVFSIVS